MRVTSSVVQQVWWGGSRRRRGRFGIVILRVFLLLAALGKPWVRDGGPVDLALGAVGWLVFLAGAAMRQWATLSVGLFLNSAVAVAGVLLASAAYLLWVIPLEEARLSTRFGEQYRSYCAVTPRLIPTFRRAHEPSSRITVELGPLLTEASRSIGWLLFPILCDVMTFLRDQPWWPHPFPVP